ncbi:unnamed protein product [Prunus armeniaca]
MHAKLPIASLSWNAMNGEQCQGQGKACQGQGKACQGHNKPRPRHDMPTQGNILNCTWCAQASCMGARFSRKTAGPVRCRLRACQASNSLTFSKWLE